MRADTITVIDNLAHQLTQTAAGALDDARADRVDVTGFTLLHQPVVTVQEDGSVLVCIAIPDVTKTRKSARAKADEAK